MSDVKARSGHQAKVDEFMRLAGQELPGSPVVPSEEVRWLRARLILEEAFETVEALGFKASAKDWSYQPSLRSASFGGHQLSFEDAIPDLEEIIDGCCDIKVVTTGTLSACGVPDEAVQAEVDSANLRKFAPGSYKREDGKWIKPPDFKHPDIAGVLKKLGE